MISNPALWFLVVAAPFCAWAAFSDLKSMTIPNRLSIAMVVAFLLPALIFLDPVTILWRLGAAIIVLVIGFVLNALRILGGGDAKFATAMAPFIAFDGLEMFMRILMVFLLAALVTHRLAGRIKFARALAPGWVSWQAGRNFPMGLALAGSLAAYLVLRMFSALPA